MNKELKKYIEAEILPRYTNDKSGHGLKHIKYVIRRSLKFAEEVPKANVDMVNVVAAYHDLGHKVDAKNHEKVSAEMLRRDEKLKDFFDEVKIEVMAEAVEDHRASNEGGPRNVYGEIVSSADRNTSIAAVLKRAHAYRSGANLEESIEGSYRHLKEKFGRGGYATKKMYFDDPEYRKFLEDLAELLDDKAEFRRRYLAENQVDELEFRARKVRPELKEYILKKIFPEYAKNDGGHNLVHILEVIRRALMLNETFALGLDEEMIYTIAAYHDLGKYQNHEIHEKIAAERFMADGKMREFFSDEKRKIMQEAILDHRSSKEDNPRSEYGKLISSADRNTTVEIVFRRSFLVGQERMPESGIEEYLDYTLMRLRKKYSEESPENMFYEDEVYREFLVEMRGLLEDEVEFKGRYCEVNGIKDREKKVADF